MDRRPGRVDDGPRLSAAVRPRAERAVGVDPDGRPLLLRPARVAPALSDRPPRPSGPSQLRRQPGLLQRREHRGQRSPRLPAPSLPPGAHAVDRLPGRGRGAQAKRAPPRSHRGVPLRDRLPGNPERNRLGGDRRRVRGRGGCRPDHPWRGDLRRGPLPRRRSAGRHLRPRQLLRLRSLRGGAALER